MTQASLEFSATEADPELPVFLDPHLPGSTSGVLPTGKQICLANHPSIYSVNPQCLEGSGRLTSV